MFEAKFLSIDMVFWGPEQKKQSSKAREISAEIINECEWKQPKFCVIEMKSNAAAQLRPFRLSIYEHVNRYAVSPRKQNNPYRGWGLVEPPLGCRPPLTFKTVVFAAVANRCLGVTSTQWFLKCALHYIDNYFEDKISMCARYKGNFCLMQKNEVNAAVQLVPSCRCTCIYLRILFILLYPVTNMF